MDKMRAAFKAWAEKEGFDTANTYDTDRSKWVWLNPMTTDLWCAWTAALAASATPEEQKYSRSLTDIHQFSMSRLPIDLREDVLVNLEHPLRIVIADAVNEAFKSGQHSMLSDMPSIGTPEGSRVYAKGYAAGRAKERKDSAKDAAAALAKQVPAQEQDKIDAQRYRFLRSQHESGSASEADCFFVARTDEFAAAAIGSMAGELDAAIDAAQLAQSADKAEG